MSYDECLVGVRGPDYMVFEFYHEFNRLYAALDQMSNFGCDVDALMDGLLLCIADHFETQPAIEKYCEEIRDVHAGMGNETDGEHLAGAARRLGFALHDVFFRHGLYEDGALYYRFFSWVNPHTVVFEKYMETDSDSMQAPKKVYQPVEKPEDRPHGWHVVLPVRNKRPYLDIAFQNFKSTGVWWLL